MRTLDTAEMENVSGGTFGLISCLLGGLLRVDNCAPKAKVCEPAPCKPAPAPCKPAKKSCW